MSMIKPRLSYKNIGLISVILLVLLMISADFFHNHPVTMAEPTDCPVYLFQVSLSSGLIFLLLLLILLDFKPNIELENGLKEIISSKK